MDAGSIETGAEIDGVSLVYLRGEHDLHSAKDVHDRLIEALDGSRGVIVDLTDSTFVDSSIVGVLLDVRHRAVGSERHFAVCLGPDSSGSVKRIFDITGLTESLPVLPDHARARAAANGGTKGD